MQQVLKKKLEGWTNTLPETMKYFSNPSGHSLQASWNIPPQKIKVLFICSCSSYSTKDSIISLWILSVCLSFDWELLWSQSAWHISNMYLWLISCIRETCRYRQIAHCLGENIVFLMSNIGKWNKNPKHHTLLENLHWVGVGGAGGEGVRRK